MFEEENHDKEEEEEKIIDSSPDKRFEKTQILLGSGAYKFVFRAYDREECRTVAWNELKSAGFNQKTYEDFKAEVSLLMSLNHPNILTTYDWWEITKKKNNRSVFQIVFISEILSTTLKQYLNSVPVIRMQVYQNWTRQILKGLAYLHNHSPPIIHRDLKCDNIFINTDCGEIKIGDMGLATFKVGEHKESCIGTVEFMAPEMFDGKYNEKVDVWAFGMTVLEMLTKEYPYTECSNNLQIINHIISGKPPLGLMNIQEKNARELIEICTKTDPNERKSCNELLELSFIQDSLSPLSKLESILVKPNEDNVDKPFNKNSNRKESHHLDEPLKERIQIKFIQKESDVIIQLELTLLFINGKDELVEKNGIKFPFHLMFDSPEEIVKEMIKKKVIPEKISENALWEIENIIQHQLIDCQKNGILLTRDLNVADEEHNKRIHSIRSLRIESFSNLHDQMEALQGQLSYEYYGESNELFSRKEQKKSSIDSTIERNFEILNEFEFSHSKKDQSSNLTYKKSSFPPKDSSVVGNATIPHEIQRNGVSSHENYELDIQHIRNETTFNSINREDYYSKRPSLMTETFNLVSEDNTREFNIPHSVSEGDFSSNSDRDISIHLQEQSFYLSANQSLHSLPNDIIMKDQSTPSSFLEESFQSHSSLYPTTYSHQKTFFHNPPLDTLTSSLSREDRNYSTENNLIQTNLSEGTLIEPLVLSHKPSLDDNHSTKMTEDKILYEINSQLNLINKSLELNRENQINKEIQLKSTKSEQDESMLNYQKNWNGEEFLDEKDIKLLSNKYEEDRYENFIQPLKEHSNYSQSLSEKSLDSFDGLNKESSLEETRTFDSNNQDNSLLDFLDLKKEGLGNLIFEKEEFMTLNHNLKEHSTPMFISDSKEFRLENQQNSVNHSTNIYSLGEKRTEKDLSITKSHSESNLQWNEERKTSLLDLKNKEETTSINFCCSQFQENCTEETKENIAHMGNAEKDHFLFLLQFYHFKLLDEELSLTPEQQKKLLNIQYKQKIFFQTLQKQFLSKNSHHEINILPKSLNSMILEDKNTFSQYSFHFIEFLEKIYQYLPCQTSKDASIETKVTPMKKLFDYPNSNYRPSSPAIHSSPKENTNLNTNQSLPTELRTKKLLNTKNTESLLKNEEIKQEDAQSMTNTLLRNNVDRIVDFSSSTLSENKIKHSNYGLQCLKLFQKCRFHTSKTDKVFMSENLIVPNSAVRNRAKSMSTSDEEIMYKDLSQQSEKERTPTFYSIFFNIYLFSHLYL